MKKVVIIGGGTGASNLLKGLKEFKIELSAIVNMVDNGGSTGILRDELGVRATGDVRQCLLALSEADDETKKLIEYRFEKGSLSGHNFGNLFLAALEKSSGDFKSAVKEAGKILKIKGNVIPSTIDEANLIAKVGRKKIKGQVNVHHADLSELTEILIDPEAKANPDAIKAIKNADVIIIAPGDFYSSILPNFLVTGIGTAIKKSKAKLIQVSNLVTKPGHTDGWSVEDFACALEDVIGREFDYVLYQCPTLGVGHLKNARPGEQAIQLNSNNDKFIGTDILDRKKPKESKTDLILRSTIRHDIKKTAKAIMSLLEAKS